MSVSARKQGELEHGTRRRDDSLFHALNFLPQKLLYTFFSTPDPKNFCAPFSLTPTPSICKILWEFQFFTVEVPIVNSFHNVKHYSLCLSSYVVEIPLTQLFKSKYIKSKTRCRYLVHMGPQFLISFESGALYRVAV